MLLRPKETCQKEKNIHYPDFLLVIRLLKQFSLPSEVFSKDFIPQDLIKKDFIEETHDLTKHLVKRILDSRLKRNDIKLFDEIYDYLSEQDNPERADLIFVFGAKTLARIEKAIQVYRKGFSSLIMISGAGPFYEKNRKSTEAERYRDFAIRTGIAGKNIIIEKKSITIADNVRRSLNLLDKKGIGYESIILVNSPYTQRRGWVHFKKYLPDNIKLIRINCLTIEKYQKDNWYKNRDGIKIILSEFAKMKIAVILNTT